MSAADALSEIYSLGLTVRLNDAGDIGIGPKELATAYRDAVREIVEPVRDELIAHLQDADQDFMKLAEELARAYGYRAVMHRRGQRPVVMVP